MNRGTAAPATQARAPTRPSRVRSAAAVRSRSLLALRVAAILVALLCWQWAAGFAAGAFPTASASISALWTMAGTSAFWTAVADTAQSWILSLVVAVVTGAAIGLAVGGSRFLTRSTRVLFDFMRTIPPVALLPLVLLELGATAKSAFVLSVFAAIWPMVQQSVDAAQQIDRPLVDVARSLRLGRFERVRSVYLPSATPFLSTGVRVAAQLCLFMTITVELLGGTPGLGTLLQNAESANAVGEIGGVVLAAGLFGLLINTVTLAQQRRVLHWHPSVRAVAS